MSTWFIYWLTRLDTINAFSQILLILSLVGIGTTLLFGMFIYIEEDQESFKPVIVFTKKYFLVPLIIGATLYTFVPTTKEAAAIYLIPKIANNEEVSKIPNKALTVLNSKLDAWIEDTLESKGK